jgi:hypothetical protein
MRFCRRHTLDVSPSGACSPTGDANEAGYQWAERRLLPDATDVLTIFGRLRRGLLHGICRRRTLTLNAFRRPLRVERRRRPIETPPTSGPHLSEGDAIRLSSRAGDYPSPNPAVSRATIALQGRPH